jgi:hypothetical protein
MNRTGWLGAGVAAAALAAGIAAAGVALAAGSSHTLHLTTTRLQFVTPSHSTFVQTDAVYRSSTKVGYETLSCNDSGQAILCSLSFAVKNGMLLGNLTIPITSTSSTAVSGKVTSGLGVFKGDKGTITGVITGKHSTYTVKYHS